MIRSIQIIFLAVLLFISYSCQKDITEDPQYKRPSWLTGKIYEQIKSLPELSTFTKCIERIGLDTIINIAGSYTVFAPNNEAFELYFKSYPEYRDSVENIPKDELTRIVKFHIIKDPWSKEQLRQLDIQGWIDTTQLTNNKPTAFKRETLLRETNRIYGIYRNSSEIKIFQNQIVDTLASSWHRRVATDANKYVSIFYKEYFDIYHLKTDDYEYYFKRPFENPQDMYYLNGRIVKGNIFAENGYVHIIDRVVEPLKNAYQILDTKKGNISYSKFLDLINNFTYFSFNKDKTDAQPGASSGAVVDSLFDVQYPVSMGIINESTFGNNILSNSNPTLQYQYGLVAPTNDALDVFEKDYVVGSDSTGTKWGSIKKMPNFMRAMIVYNHMSFTPIFPSQFQKGFINFDNDYVKIDQELVEDDEYGSNCSFLGYKKVLVPRYFTSVTGPIFTYTNYKFSLYALNAAGLLTALKDEKAKYSLFIESDNDCKTDSSLIFEQIITSGEEIVTYTAYQKNGATYQAYPLNKTDLRIKFLNHIGIGVPKGLPVRKEFIKNLFGNYIIIDNETGVASGTAQTYYGYQGVIPVQVKPKQFPANADNGVTYKISNWFSFSAIALYTRLSTASQFSKFDSLLYKAGLANRTSSKYTFLSDNEYYTVFAPTNAALTAYRADTISVAGDRLKKFLMAHFVQGAMIFTDGNRPSGYYETMRIDEKSTPYTTIYSKIYIVPDINVINIKDKNGANYLSVPESTGTNYITGRSLSTGTPKFPEYISTGVIHQIDKVLLITELDAK